MKRLDERRHWPRLGPPSARHSAGIATNDPFGSKVSLIATHCECPESAPQQTGWLRLLDCLIFAPHFFRSQQFD